MNEEILVSIGLPTYNRPEGLRRALTRITQQTYKNLEIIVSDNFSPDPEVGEVVKQFQRQDPRVKFIRQSKNIGASANFRFVLEQASGEYFMWASDDDYFESHKLIEALVGECSSHILVFPDFNIFTKPDKLEIEALEKIYGECRTAWHYLKAWSRSISGYPVYGMYNLKMLEKENIVLKFDEELSYYNEGTLLHRIFLSGKVKFVPNVYIRLDNNSNRPDSLTMMRNFSVFSKASFALILGAKAVRKFRIIRNVFICCRTHFGQLYKQSKEIASFPQVARLVLVNPVLLAYVISLIYAAISAKLAKIYKKAIKSLFSKPLAMAGFKLESKRTIYQEQANRTHELMQHELLSNRWLIDMQIKTVIDVGANTGQFSQKILSFLPDVMIYSFEPIKSCYEELSRNLFFNGNVKLFNFALGDTDGEQTIYLNDFTPSSSLLEMDDLHKKAFAYTEKCTPEVIQVRRLDAMISEMVLQRPILLKIDVQGYEREVIRGGLETIKQVDVMIVETSFSELYKNQPLFHEIYGLLRAQGFVYKGNYEQLINPNNGEILQADSLFIRATSEPVA
jgi:FkbM family methyltransferase